MLISKFVMNPTNIKVLPLDIDQVTSVTSLHDHIDHGE